MYTVALIGATNNTQRYAHKAQQLLMEKGYRVIPVTPKYEYVQGLKAVPSPVDITEKVDTVSVYVNSHILETLIDDICALSPRRLILNPGTESAAAEQKARASKIHVISACTIVLLSTNQF